MKKWFNIMAAKGRLIIARPALQYATVAVQ
jgi:hypothetical protein